MTVKNRIISLMMVVLMMVGILPYDIYGASTNSEILGVSYGDPLSTHDTRTSIELNITGNGFYENIKQVRLKNELTNKVITIPKKYGESSNITFTNTGRIKAILRGTPLNEIKKKENVGVHRIYIDYENGKSATSKVNSNTSSKLVVYEKPYVMETEPKLHDWLVDKNDLYKSFTNGESGSYLTVVFNNINEQLKKGDKDLESNDLDLFKEGDENTSLLDTGRDIIYEGFKEDKSSRTFKLKTSAKVIEKIYNPYTSAKLYLDNDEYRENDTVKITLFDNDLNQNSNIREQATVLVTRGDETKEITLRETGNDTGRFEGNIEVWKPFDENNKKNDNIEVRYVDLNSADMSTENVVIETADIKDRAINKRNVQMYIEKSLYEKGETVNIVVESQEKNKNKDLIETFNIEAIKNTENEGDDIKPEDTFSISLKETGKNTGIFKGETDKLEGNFDLIYTHEKPESTSVTGKAKVHIPIQNLEDGVKYKASIPEGLVLYQPEIITDIDYRLNDKYEWAFKTGVASNTDRDFQTSAPEDYDRHYYIVLNGANYNEKTNVYFRDSLGDEHKGETQLVGKRTDILHVYPPARIGRLKPGLYDIVIENSKHGKEVIEYGVFSVLEKGKHSPKDDYLQQDKDVNGDTIKEGEIKKHIKISKDTIELNSKYTNSKELSLNLDELMGEDVWSRSIAYRGYNNETIDRLITKSKWADVTLKNVSLDKSTDNKDIEIKLGRAEPTVSSSIKSKLIGEFIKSDFIQISGSNYKIDSAELSLPYRESGGDNLKVRRYDEDTRRIDTNISFRVDKNNKKVEITNAKKGIYVIVE